MIKLLLILALFGCKKHKEVDVQVVDPAIAAKSQLYRYLNADWSSEKCDSLGFTALCKLSGGCQEADIFTAEDDGMWYRSADHKCYDTGESASDFSKDMMVMLLPYLYSTGNIGAIKRIKDYGRGHGWRFGRGPVSRTQMTPPIIAMIYKMTNERVPPQEVQTEERTQKRGFEKHLDAVWMLTSAMVGGGVSDSQLKTIENYMEENPNNALFQALFHKYKDGDQSAAIAILLNEKWFPSDRLPTPRDRCETYLWQRDSGPDWEPCEADSTHDGIDFLFAAWVAGQL